MSERRRGLAFATVLTAFVLEIIDSTIVNTALPAIQAGLGASSREIQWIVAAYFLSFAVFMVLSGRLGDLVGYRRVFLLGVATFTAASLSCGLATTGQVLLLCRFAQGTGAAIMAPQIIAIVQLLYSPRERVARLATFGILGGLAGIGGPIIGGLLIQLNFAGLGWRPIFLVNVPVGIAALVAGQHLLPSGRSGHPLRLDPFGAILLGAALLALLVPLIGDGQSSSIGRAAMLLGSFTLFAIFWRYSLKRVRVVGSALIAPELFDERPFSLGLVMSLLFGASTTGFLLILSMTLQQGLGFTAFQSAMIHIPFGFGVMIGISTLGPRGLRRYGPKVLALGAIIMAAGCIGVAIAIVMNPNPLAWIVPALLVSGIGMGCVIGPLGAVTLARVDRGHAGVAGGMHNATQQVGGALGAAIVGSIFFRFGSHTIVMAFAAATGVVTVLLAAVAAFATTVPKDIFLVD